MHFAFTPDQLELADAVRGALEAECSATVLREAWDTPQPQLWRLLAELGVLGISTPQEAGGLGMGAVDWVLILQEAGRVALPVPLAETIAGLPALVAAGQTDQATEILSGERTLSIVHEGVCTAADTAAAILSIQGEALHLYDDPQCTRQPTLDGGRTLYTVQGDTSVISQDAQAVIDRVTLATSAELLGLGHRVLEMAVDYAKARTQFSKPIGSFQAVQHHLVDALLKLRFAEPLVYRAAWSMDESDPDRSTHIAMAKIAASEAASLACRKSLQVHGAIGYTLELDLHMWMKRVWALTHAWGSPAHHRRTAAKLALGDAHA